MEEVVADTVPQTKKYLRLPPHPFSATVPPMLNIAYPSSSLLDLVHAWMNFNHELDLNSQPNGTELCLIDHVSPVYSNLNRSRAFFAQHQQLGRVSFRALDLCPNVSRWR